MLRKHICVSLVLCFTSLLFRAAAADEPAGDEAAIRAAIQSYVDAFNRHDAEALANHWSAAGEFVTPAGDVLAGREQLTREFSAYFSEEQKVRLELVDPAIEMLSPGVAREEGVAAVLKPDAEPTKTHYVAIHIKTPDGWKMDSVREQLLDEPVSHYQQLKELEWMVGEWVDAGEAGTVETRCQWTKNRNFLTRSFKVYVEDRIDFEGTEIIGWDPLNKTIRSWVFNSAGAFGVGQWTRDENRWTTRMLSVTPDGQRGSGTIVMDKVDEDSYIFRTIGRQIAGELMPNVDPVTVVRR